MSILTLAELAVDHPYYCETSNYFSNDWNMTFETVTDFLAEFDETTDLNMNHVFRWDVKPDDDGYSAYVYFMLQRKGIFMPCTIERIVESDVPAFVEFLRKHRDHQAKMWAPL
ncbi:hypothetical protein NVP1081O_206 [Vibrio phage 1.081.O._10N.286.52.C2]|nr:hypothetical protein NVP1081O_206 [Vibrio phage 1.081.O._10N.286.52.C2]